MSFGQRLAAIEDADVIEPEKAAGKDVLAARVFAIDPPGEVDQQFLKRAGQEHLVALLRRTGRFVDLPHAPGMHRRIDVAEMPFVGGDLAAGMHVPFAQEQDHLFLGKVGIQAGHRHHVKGQVPGGVPGILPLVGHRDHVAIEQVPPIAVASFLSRRTGRHAVGIAVEPGVDGVVIELFRPQQSCVGLPHDLASVVRQGCGNPLGVELVGLANPLLEAAIERIVKGRLGETFSVCPCIVRQ